MSTLQEILEKKAFPVNDPGFDHRVEHGYTNPAMNDHGFSGPGSRPYNPADFQGSGQQLPRKLPSAVNEFFRQKLAERDKHKSIVDKAVEAGGVGGKESFNDMINRLRSSTESHDDQGRRYFNPGGSPAPSGNAPITRSFL